MASIKVPTEIWDMIVNHYSTIKSPTMDDKNVLAFIADKEMRRMNREDFLESKARYARIRDWENSEGN